MAVDDTTVGSTPYSKGGHSQGDSGAARPTPSGHMDALPPEDPIRMRGNRLYVESPEFNNRERPGHGDHAGVVSGDPLSHRGRGHRHRHLGPHHLPEPDSRVADQMDGERGSRPPPGGSPSPRQRTHSPARRAAG